MKFKRINIHSLAVKEGVSYCSVDLLRQSSVECFARYLCNRGHSTPEIKEIVLSNIGVLIDRMIVDDEISKGGKR